MNNEQMTELAHRAAVYSALADPGRLQIVDILMLGDASPSELMKVLGVPSNLMAHHVKVLRDAGLVASHRSQGDGRKQYLRLLTDGFDLRTPAIPTPGRVVFVCTANSARSQLASALWRQASPIPATSAGTHPAEDVDPGALQAADRRGLPMGPATPQHLDHISTDDTDGGDLIITVCDLAHEEIGLPNRLHWSIPDPVGPGTAAAYDAAYDEIEARVRDLAARLAS